MNGMTEPLPGLLDDPQFQITDLPALTDFHIAPLRNPAPLRHANVPLPLEPVTGNAINGSRSSRAADGVTEKRRTPKITPADVLLAREAKKPHLAISELLEDNDGSEMVPTQLPSFISLSVVEKSPIQTPSALGQGPALKRARLDPDSEFLSHDLNRHLPRPAQKNGRQSRPAPLLPAMVTGLHEPPPSAALLPSMDIDVRPGVARTTSSKIKVTDILMSTDAQSPSPTSNMVPASSQNDAVVIKDVDFSLNSPLSNHLNSGMNNFNNQTAKDNKTRRTRRKWTDDETRDLLAGVKKYGTGKWKLILDDVDFSFVERSSVDLKDRYRVCAKEEGSPTPLLSTNIANSSNGSIDTSTTPTPASTNIEATVNSPQPTPSASEPSPLLQQQKQRRKRRAWTSSEDDALLKGVAKHGFQWTAIHDDPELDLSHRRATDLRDRIRNKFPDGYRHAETAPLRSEVRKAEKLGQGSNVANERLSSMTVSDDIGVGVGNSSNMTTSTRPPPPPLLPTALLPPASEADKDRERERERERQRDRDREKEKEQAGVTLPSLTLEDDDMDWDNRLPPVLLGIWDYASV